MSNVKIKKSVLQSIIKKSLSESGGKYGDVSRRLTVGPEGSSLPSMLPLSPSDRMSTQLEVERPPVEDPEYTPANPKELGLALQALSEMISVDQVDQAYDEFKKIIERLEEEADSDKDMQIESLRRKNAILGAILRESRNNSDLMMKFIEAQRQIAPRFSNVKGQSPSPIDNVNQNVAAVVSKINDEFERVGFDVQDYMEALSSALEERGVSIDFRIDDYSERPLSGIDVESGSESDDTSSSSIGAPPSTALGQADDDDDDFTPQQQAEYDELARQLASGPEAVHFKYERVLRAYGLSKTNFMDMHRLVRTRELTEGDLEEFLELLGALQNDPEIVSRVGSKLRSPMTSPDALLRFISRFKDNYEEKVARDAAAAADKARPKFEYQTAAKPFGYAAASGLRQSFIRDVLGVRALNAFIAPKRIQRYVVNSIREAFNDAFELPENQEFLKTLFDEEGLEEYKSVMQDPSALNQSALFQNFAGAVTYEALASIAELNFKPHRGQPGRQIGKAFMTEFGDENKKLQSHEEDQLERMAQRGEYADFVNDILDASEENGHRGLLTAAAAMTADDADKEEYGSYASPAFSTMKKAASVAKPPELHVADYMGKDDPMVGQIKAADRAARKAARK
jgi:hypothetical protein